jgi:hypothetical protein
VEIQMYVSVWRCIQWKDGCTVSLRVDVNSGKTDVSQCVGDVYSGKTDRQMYLCMGNAYSGMADVSQCVGCMYTRVEWQLYRTD